jgi:UDPglucose 6-dehydrogenase
LTFATDLAAAVRECEVVFIAVGTPSAEDGSADLGNVESAAREIARALDGYKVIVDKSTVPVGTARKVKAWIAEELAHRGATLDFDVISNPEFLREGSAVHDFTHPDRVVIGADSDRARTVMKDVYRALYINETPFIETNLETAELIKYASNAFLAMKIAFINEIANLCEKAGANVQEVAKAMGRDGRIGPKFLHPGPGYGGSCLPKDTRALARTGRQLGEPLAIIEAVIASNERQKSRMVEKIDRAMGGVAGKTIAVLGLAFKPNTDDMREAPAIVLCAGLAAKGARIKAWDPVAMREASARQQSIRNRIEYAQDEYNAIEGAHALVLMTEWNQLRNLDLERVRQLLRTPFFFDLRNIYKRPDVVAKGLNYVGVGQ